MTLNHQFINEDDFNQSGLLMNHAYSLKNLHEFIVNGETYRFIKLRNPWGKNRNFSHRLFLF